DRAEDVDVPARQVQLGEGDVLGPDHQREQEVPQGRGDAGDDEGEDHDRPVEREEPVVDRVVVAHGVAVGVEELAGDVHRAGGRVDHLADGGHQLQAQGEGG